MPTKISWRRREEAGGAMMQPGCMRRLLGDGREGEGSWRTRGPCFRSRPQAFSFSRGERQDEGRLGRSGRRMGIDPMLGGKEARVGLASIRGQGDSQRGKESQSSACEGLVEEGDEVRRHCRDVGLRQSCDKTEFRR